MTIAAATAVAGIHQRRRWIGTTGAMCGSAGAGGWRSGGATIARRRCRGGTDLRFAGDRFEHGGAQPGAAAARRPTRRAP